MKASIVLGSLFGDEGKGSFVNQLCLNTYDPVVVRFNGGHQVGHTVVLDDIRHVFSNFGSGTLTGAPTYWSRFCTVDPVGVKREGDVLREHDINPEIFFDANAMITTPFDILSNHNNVITKGHGTVGVGFGQTIQRNEDHYKLFARDLLYPKIRDQKLELIYKNYYNFSFNSKDKTINHHTHLLYNEFIDACDDLVNNYQIVDSLDYVSSRNLIFEGGQGIMLDKDYGFFPNVTRSNCTSKNAMTLLNELNGVYSTSTYYITRAYQCRHGNGHMTNQGIDTSYIIDNPNETNVDGKFQGDFRKTVLDLDMLKYAIECDRYENPQSYKHMVVTCLDQVPEDIPVTINGNLTTVKWSGIGNYCNIMNKYASRSEKGVDLSETPKFY